MKKNILLKSLILGLLLSAQSFAYPNANEQEEINNLVQTGIYYYWHGGDLKKAEKEIFKGITLKGKYDLVENAFKKASLLDPNRIDLKMSIASTQIIQKKIDEALSTYNEILKQYPNDFESRILLAAYLKAKNNGSEFDKNMAILEKNYPEKTSEYKSIFEIAEKNMKLKINIMPFKVTEKHTIVILGYALGNNGEMKEPLIGRLNKGLEMFKENPDSTIIVSGGVQKSGVTEAYLMSKWLQEKGVPKDKIYLDDLAKDTVGNAINSAEILSKISPKKVTLVTSASHIRRGITVLEEAVRKKNLNIDFSNLVYLDYPNLEEAQKVNETERVVIYRDLMRTSGIWAYPGIQQ